MNKSNNENKLGQGLEIKDIITQEIMYKCNAGKRFHIQTFGCQMNERDSETLAGMLINEGYEETTDKKQGHVFIINTCSVRENADKRFFGTLGQLKKIKEENRDAVVCICGCMMQQQHIIDEVKSKYPWVDIIFGTHNIHQFPRLLNSVIMQREKQLEIWSDSGEIVENLPAKRKYKYKAFVNIMYGCNNFCTYCIVPFTRGRERSRDPKEIIREVRLLVADGVKEITLLGQNVNSYKHEDSTFVEILYALEKIEGLDRIRFMTSHPKDLSDELILAFKECKKLCGHIHLPVQSGSDSVLKKMNRRYTRQDYLKIVKKLRNARPDIAITTDIIVGFPGEEEEDFQDTLNLCREVKFDSAFTFIYSPRRGTPAEKYCEQVAEDVKHERFNRLMTIINDTGKEKNQEKIGQMAKVLVEGSSKKNKETLTGRTEDFKTIDFVGDKKLIGEIVETKVIRASSFSLWGEIK